MNKALALCLLALLAGCAGKTVPEDRAPLPYPEQGPVTGGGGGASDAADEATYAGAPRRRPHHPRRLLGSP